MVQPRTSWRRGRWTLLLLPLLLAAAWFGGRAIVRAHVDAVLAGATGHPLPAFSLRDQQGRTWDPAVLRGRPVLLHFFRSHCPSCDAEAAELRQLERELPEDQATILHVLTDAVLGFDPRDTAATLASKAFARPVLTADAAFMVAFHSVTWSHVTPVSYVVAADGTIRTALRGPQTAAGLRAALAAHR